MNSRHIYIYIYNSRYTTLAADMLSVLNLSVLAGVTAVIFSPLFFVRGDSWVCVAEDVGFKFTLPLCYRFPLVGHTMIDVYVYCVWVGFGAPRRSPPRPGDVIRHVRSSRTVSGALVILWHEGPIT